MPGLVGKNKNNNISRLEIPFAQFNRRCRVAGHDSCRIL